jgi:uncharacterized protein with von Willebrand factor type A (vWA) domain
LTQPYGDDIPREAWLGLYSPNNPLKGIPPTGMEVVHSIFKRAERMPEWKRLRASIEMDPLACAFGAAYFSKDLISKLPEDVKEKMENAQIQREGQQDLEDQIQQLENLAQALGSDRTNDDPSGEGGSSLTQTKIEEQIQELRNKLEESRSKVDQSTDEAISAIENADSQIQHALAQSMMDATDSLEHLKSAANEFGYGWDVGSNGGVSLEHVEGLYELSEYIRASKYLRMILELIGWAKRMVSCERRKSKHGRERFTHFQIRDLDLETLAPQELVNLVAFAPGSDLHAEFLCRALDGDLLHSYFEGDDHAGRGPMVFLRDESGSMRGWQRAVSCALQLALMNEAHKEKRRFISIPFSGRGQFYVYDPGHNPDPIELLHHLEFTYGHGTCPYEPLLEAIRIIKEDGSMKSGDILVITDGAFSTPPEEFIEILERAREEPGLRIVSIVVDSEPGQAHFADKVVLVSDIFEEKEKLAEAVAALF